MSDVGTETEEDENLPQRKRPAHLPSFSPINRAIIQFVTVCTKDRARVLTSPEAHQILREIWANDRIYRVGRYVIMPDHVHLFCSPSKQPPESLKRWISFWKSTSAQKFPTDIVKLWQRDFWDTQLRGRESYASKWNYVRNNPVRAGLVNDAEDWPYQGEISPLLWHD